VRLADARQTLGIGEEGLRLPIRAGRLRIGPASGGAVSVTDRSVDEVRDLFQCNTDSLARYGNHRAGLFQ
jgi:hypothetical protein